MSHVAKIDLEITDKESLLAAAAACRLEVLSQNTYKWYGYSVGDFPLPEGFSVEDLGKCDFVLSVKGNPHAYQIGVVQRGGKYVLLWDFFAGGYGLQEKIGTNGSLLKKEYVKNHAIKSLKQKGFNVHSVTDSQGKQRIEMRRYS